MFCGVIVLIIENSVKEKYLKTATLIGNIILWVSLLPSILVAFASMFGTDAFGTGLYTKFQENLIMIEIMICLYSPMIIFMTAILSLILRKGKLLVLSLWVELVPFILFLIVIILSALVEHLS